MKSMVDELRRAIKEDYPELMDKIINAGMDPDKVIPEVRKRIKDFNLPVSLIDRINKLDLKDDYEKQFEKSIPFTKKIERALKNYVVIVEKRQERDKSEGH